MPDELGLTMQKLEKAMNLTVKGVEYWRARDLMDILGYDRWENFEKVIGKAMDACRNIGNPIKHHFLETTQKVSIGSGATTNRRDFFLDRYASYLVAMNGDSAKPSVADAQTYFAVQTRKQEVQEQAGRLEWREKLKDATKELNSAAKAAGVQKFGIFHDKGYKGLYGMGLDEIKKRKKLRPDEKLFDRAGLTELAANAFRATQTKEALKKSGVRNEEAAGATHFKVGRTVRETMRELSGTTPEDLPAEAPIKTLKQSRKQMLPAGDQSDPSKPLL